MTIDGHHTAQLLTACPLGVLVVEVAMVSGHKVTLRGGRRHASGFDASAAADLAGKS
jgi:hypothetical protein